MQIVVVEEDVDLVLALGQIATSYAVHGLRYDGYDLGAQVQLEVDRIAVRVRQKRCERIALAIAVAVRHAPQGSDVHIGVVKTEHIDSVQVVRQRFGKTHDHFVGRSAQPDEAWRDDNVVVDQVDRRVVDRGVGDGFILIAGRHLRVD